MMGMGMGMRGTCQYGCQKPIISGRVDEEVEVGIGEVEDADGDFDLGTLFDREGCDSESGFLCRNVPVPDVDFPFVPPFTSSSSFFSFSSYPISLKNLSFLRSFPALSLFNHPITRATRKSTTMGRTERAM
jgi:hypothetical protein